MTARSHRSLRCLATALGVLPILAASSLAATFPHNITLVPGWNAMWFDFEPIYSTGARAGEPMDVADFFSDPSVTIVARPEVPVGSAEFIGNSSGGIFDQEAWSVWRRTSELNANTLATIRGNRAYLIHSTAKHTLSFSAQVGFFRPAWVPASYNLLGFSIDIPLSFDEFFASSNGVHPVDKIFRLGTDGNWTSVRGADSMRPGEAYWIYAERSSRFMGPVAIEFDGAATTGRLDFGDGPGGIEVPDPQGGPGDTIDVTLRELTFTNLDGASRDVTISKLDPSTFGAAAVDDILRLYHIVPQAASLDHAIGPQGQIIYAPSLATVVPAASATVTLGAHRNWTAGEPLQENLYRIEITLDGGNARQQFWLPVTAGRSELEQQLLGTPDHIHAGLWIGEAQIEQVTSLTEDGNPLRPTTSVAPMRILIHIDSSGAGSLLGHVLLMQEQTADPTIPPAQVLVVDETRIPFFEGIELRDGKRVGRRFETTSYDLPRRMDRNSQAALIALAALALGKPEVDITEDDIRNFVNGHASRPPALVEEYHLGWPLDGGLQAGSVLRTSTSAPLTLDPFHRSNPFRHAFHPRHGAGASVERSFAVRIDEQVSDDTLIGSFEETITGLVAQPLTSAGPLTLQRVCTVDTLQ